MFKSNVYRVYVDDDGKVICPECNTIIYPDYDYNYEFIGIDGYYGVFSIIIKCLRCSCMAEVTFRNVSILSFFVIEFFYSEAVQFSYVLVYEYV